MAPTPRHGRPSSRTRWRTGTTTLRTTGGTFLRTLGRRGAARGGPSGRAGRRPPDPRSPRRPGEVWVLLTTLDDGPAVGVMLEHWTGQGVTHFAVADLGSSDDTLATLREKRPGVTVLVRTDLGGGVPWHDALNALASTARRAGADWVVPTRVDESGLAQEGPFAAALAGQAADVVDMPVHEAFATPEGTVIDRSRGSGQVRVAFRCHLLAWVGPGATWVDRPGRRATGTGLHLVRSVPDDRRPRGPVVPVDLDDWASWDPEGRLAGPDVVRSDQVPGAGASRARRPGRTVIVAPPWMGFGNLLYLLLAAHTRRVAGQDCRVLATPTLERWSASLGTLGDLTVSDVRRRDRREDPLLRTYGAFGLDFTAAELGDFVRARLLASPALAPARESAPAPGRVTLNVRRGDYYSVPEFRASFGFDQVAYVRAALQAAQERGPVDEVRIVSDGPQWCRARLGWLGERHRLVIADPADSALANFVDVATARRLVITNSTFSYWAAHVGNALHGDNHADTVAPWFFSRAEADGRAYQLDPRWRVVADVPGGWNASTGEGG